MLQGFDDNIDDFEVTKQAVEAGDAQTVYKQLIGQYEKTVAHIKDAATKEYAEINAKIEAKEVLTEHEVNRISKAIVILNGITELETNETVLKFLVENDDNERVKKDLKNHFFTRRAEEDFVRKMRTVKIKAANVKGNYDLIMAVKNTEFRNKLMYYYATFLNSFKNNSTTIDALRYFVVFQMGMFRISIQTGYTFE